MHLYVENVVREMVIVYFIIFLLHAVCSGAPNCMSLNRHPCSEVPNTCGPCFTRHLGEEGFSNTSCFGIHIIVATSFTEHGSLSISHLSRVFFFFFAGVINLLLHFEPYSILTDVTIYTDPCIDGIMNYDETDIDCGGPLCPSCQLGEVHTNVTISDQIWCRHA